MEEVICVLENVKVINIMADGTVCEDLSTYLDEDHPLPELTARLVCEFVREGRAGRMTEGG